MEICDWGGIGAAFSIFLVQILFPLYFAEIFPNGQGQTSNKGFIFSMKQIGKLTLKPYGFLVAVIVLYVSINLFWTYRKKLLQKGKHTVPYEVCQMVFILQATILIARNGGTYYTYYLQLWWPYVILFAFEIMKPLTDIIQNMPVLKKVASCEVGVLFMYFLIILTVFQCRGYLVSMPLSKQQKEDWKIVYSLLDSHMGEDILVSAHLSEYCIEHGIITSEYGQAEFNGIKNLASYRGNLLWQTLFPLADDILQNNIDYNETVVKNIQMHRYGCIALTGATRYWLDEELLLKAGYVLTEERTLYTGKQAWDTKCYILGKSGLDEYKA